MVVNRLSYPIDDCRVSQPEAWLRWGRLDLHCTKGVAGSADFLEIHVARKIVAAGRQSLHGRRQVRFEFDEAADWRSGTLSYGDAHALWSGGDPGRVETLNSDHNTIATFPFLADFNKSRKGRACD